jgi:exodeoxyribonuclease III
MKIVTYNVNGIRSALNKGLKEWVQATAYDVYCFQEIKIDHESLRALGELFPGYSFNAFPAEKKGYSGVSILTKTIPLNITTGIDHAEFDGEGRTIVAEYDDFLLMNCYFPSGSSGESRQEVKDRFLEYFYSYIQSYREGKKPLVIVGDYNICHKPIDIHNPVSNKNSSGFLPHEREWMSRFFELGYIDSFRAVNPEPHNYTWWSFRANARAKNLGWRIDYQAVDERLGSRIVDHKILPEITFSDHCPTVLTLGE